MPLGGLAWVKSLSDRDGTCNTDPGLGRQATPHVSSRPGTHSSQVKFADGEEEERMKMAGSPSVLELHVLAVRVPFLGVFANHLHRR